MYLLILAAIAVSPVVALLATLAFAVVRIDCYGGIRIMGLRISRVTKKWAPAPPLASVVPLQPALEWAAFH